MNTALARLRATLLRHESLAVAISGGVDSTTLAAVAHEELGRKALMVHAMSPAVAPEATARVERYALQFGWKLKLVDAGEFDDEQYRLNPVDRCYYCKSNLYRRVRHVWQGSVASGANMDDLGDYRPGLLAAKESAVVHPLIDAGIDKAMVRVIARYFGLEEVAELPAQPCLSSRIETGISIDADDLSFVHKVEKQLIGILGSGDVRCRITAYGVRVEVDDCLQRTDAGNWTRAQAEVASLIEESGRTLAGFSPYQRGSAFLVNEKIK